MSHQGQRKTSEVFVEIERPGKPPVRTTYDAYIYASAAEVPLARFFVVAESGERIYLTGGLVETAACIAGYRRAHIAAVREAAVQQ